jgi:hypothetical protein
MTTLFAALSAFAAPRTFVASTGSDTNPCSISQPCRSFGIALTKTAPYGEIVVLDSAGYGPVTVSQPVTITAPPGVYAGISASNGTNGVTIIPPAPSAAVPPADVTLRGLTIAGGDYGVYAASVPGQSRINIEIDRCTITTTNLGGIGIIGNVSGKITQSRISHFLMWGIDVRDGAVVDIDRSDVSNELDPFGGAIRFLATIDGILTSGSVTNSNFSNAAVAIYATMQSGTSATLKVGVAGNTIVSSGFGIALSSAGPGQVVVSATGNTIWGGNGLSVNGPGTTIIASGNQLTGGTYGIQNVNLDGTVITLQNNTVENNVTDIQGPVTLRSVR